jgi:uncharacterized membrane protein (DUF485 family)
MTPSPALAAEPVEATYETVQDSPEFADLRRRFRRFVFPMTGLFLGWYFAYVLLATYAHGFMSTKVVGNINVALIFGLLQFVSTFTITMLYARWSAREMDPAAEELCSHLEFHLERNAAAGGDAK